MSLAYRRLPPLAAPVRPSLLPLAVASAATLATVLARDWIAGAAVILLWVAWHVLQPEVGPPVLPLAFSFQWVQVFAGIFYFALTGREIRAMYETDYRPMVLIGFGCLVALLLGLRLGMQAVQMRRPADLVRTQAFEWPTLVQLYVASVVLNGFLREVAWQIPQLTQPILMLSYCRYALLFLIFRRLTAPRLRWGWMGSILAAEILLGFTGYFAEFREALMIAALALLERFDRRDLRHWFGMGFLAALTFLTGLIWMSIRSQYRGEMATGELSGSRVERLERVGTLTSRWFTSDTTLVWVGIDAMMQRLWAVQFPALAVSRVPAVLPHEHGAILWRAVRHVLTPRLLFPDKPAPPADSEMVERYAGVRVAQGTNMAFGYAVESYVDFGVPWMFLPVLLYGLAMGAAYKWFERAIRHRELAAGLLSALFWLSLYQFDRSWLKTIGLAGTLLVYLGGAGLLLDRYLLGHRAHRRRAAR